MSSVIVIETQPRLHALVEDLAQAPYIAVDTESNSFYAYFERVCLIQISTEEQDYIVDPIAIPDLKPLESLLSSPHCEKIFHAASNDILGLKRDFQFTFSNIFDTAIAAKLLGYNRLGLANILEEHFEVHLNKKWQRHDWGKRPLKEEHLDYARMDTHYLIPLRHRLEAELRSLELWDTALEAFVKACDQETHARPFQPGGFIQIHGARSLDPIGKRILKALYLFRENEARKRDRAPFRILSNETLLRLALFRPTSVDEIKGIKGLPHSYQNGRAAHNLLDLIRRTRELAEEAKATN